VKEFGLILLVFTIGLQLGPGFFAALRQQGLALNALAATVVALGALTALALGRLLGIDPAAVLGLLSGATTNTPSLGAAQQTLTTLPGVVATALLGVGSGFESQSTQGLRHGPKPAPRATHWTYPI
jgi:putative transport protein